MKYFIINKQASILILIILLFVLIPAIGVEANIDQPADLTAKSKVVTADIEHSTEDNKAEVNNDSVAAEVLSVENTVQANDKDLNLLTSEGFYCVHNRWKVPVKLEWEDVEGANSYEVVIHRQYTNRKVLLRVNKNKKHIMVYPNARYKWKVGALDKGNKLIAQFSKNKNLYVKAPEGERTVSKYELNYPEFNGELEKIDHSYEFDLSYASADPVSDQNEENINEENNNEVTIARVPTSVQDNNYTTWSRFWLNIGTGLNLTSYEQEVTDTATLAYDAVKSPNFRGEVGFFMSDKIAMIASGFQSPGNLVDENTNLNEDYTWTSYSLEGVYLFGDGKVNNSVKSNWYLRYGLHQHKLPLLEVFPSSSELFILENTLINFGLGIGNRTKFSNDLRTDLYVRYQHPVSSKANRNTYSLDSGMLLDLYFAANYQLHRNFHMGLFLNSQYFNLEYSLTDNFESVQGTQGLFNNIFGMYLGFEL